MDYVLSSKFTLYVELDQTNYMCLTILWPFQAFSLERGAETRLATPNSQLHD